MITKTELFIHPQRAGYRQLMSATPPPTNPPSWITKATHLVIKSSRLLARLYLDYDPSTSHLNMPHLLLDTANKPTTCNSWVSHQM